MSIKNGDLPAMPVVYTSEYPTNIGYEKHEEVCFGLTKREQFAMAMAQGILSNQGASLVSDEISTSTAELAVLVADALLAELEK